MSGFVRMTRPREWEMRVGRFAGDLGQPPFCCLLASAAGSEQTAVVGVVGDRTQGTVGGGRCRQVGVSVPVHPPFATSCASATQSRSHGYV
eukprot:scaffold33632_cov135-Isochrysis_galbana.AAC.1